MNELTNTVEVEVEHYGVTIVYYDPAGDEHFLVLPSDTVILKKLGYAITNARLLVEANK